MSALNEMKVALLRTENLLKTRPEIVPLSRPEVSGWSVGEHLDHLIKVASGVSGRILAGPREGAPTSSLSFTGKVVLLLGRIPRGRAKSPAGLEGEKRTVDELRNSLAQTRFESITSEHLRGRLSVGKHPVFGELSASEWLRFLVVHHRHHERIIGYILRKAD